MTASVPCFHCLLLITKCLVAPALKREFSRSKRRHFFFPRESYRSHRKSIIIDGQIAYVGGVNLADEYFNRIKRFGYWKDAMLRVEGDSVNSLTLSFLSMWDHQSKQPLDKSEYLVKKTR